MPENVEGYGFVLSETDAAAPPTVSFTLYCQPSAFEGIYRAFMVGFSGEKGSTMLSLKIDCPNNCGGDFWNGKWLSEWWRVVSWKLYASSQNHDKSAQGATEFVEWVERSDTHRKPPGGASVKGTPWL